MKLAIAALATVWLVACGTAHDQPEPPSPPPPVPVTRAESPAPPPSVPEPDPVLSGSAQLEEISARAAADTILDGDRADRERLRARVWNTTLGRMYRAYLFDPADEDRRGHELRLIVQRTFDSVALTEARVLGILLMSDDVLARGLGRDVIRDRIERLKTMLSLRRLALEIHSSYGILDDLPAFVILALAAGSSELREQAKAVSTYGWRRLRSLLPFGDGQEDLAREAADRLRWRRLFGKELLNEYSLSSGGRVALTAFGIYAVFYVQKKSGTPDVASVTEKLWIYGLQNFDRVDDL